MSNGTTTYYLMRLQIPKNNSFDWYGGATIGSITAGSTSGTISWTSDTPVSNP
ncbi:MAG TPA: hypothetical protein VNI54_17705 [Thermoanaerobaculia bacterium]|nr:hypothetical protein [Thermoanaerobaculia bacterium]